MLACRSNVVQRCPGREESCQRRSNRGQTLGGLLNINTTKAHSQGSKSTTERQRHAVCEAASSTTPRQTLSRLFATGGVRELSSREPRAAQKWWRPSQVAMACAESWLVDSMACVALGSRVLGPVHICVLSPKPPVQSLHCKPIALRSICCNEGTTSAPLGQLGGFMHTSPTAFCGPGHGHVSALAFQRTCRRRCVSFPLLWCQRCCNRVCRVHSRRLDLVS